MTKPIFSPLLHPHIPIQDVYQIILEYLCKKKNWFKAHHIMQKTPVLYDCMVHFCNQNNKENPFLFSNRCWSYAAKYNCKEIIPFLIQIKLPGFSSYDLTLAAEFGNVDCFLLLKSFFESCKQSDKQREEYQSALSLQKAAFNGHVEMVQVLMEDKSQFKNNAKAVELACQAGHLQVLQLLLDQGHTSNLTFKVALEYNQKVVLDFLCQRQRSSSMTTRIKPKLLVTKHKHEQLVRWLKGHDYY